MMDYLALVYALSYNGCLQTNKREQTQVQYSEAWKAVSKEMGKTEAECMMLYDTFKELMAKENIPEGDVPEMRRLAIRLRNACLGPPKREFRPQMHLDKTELIDRILSNPEVCVITLSEPLVLSPRNSTPAPSAPTEMVADDLRRCKLT